MHRILKVHSAVVTCTFEKYIVPGTTHSPKIHGKKTCLMKIIFEKLDLPSHDLVGENIVGHL